MFGGCLCGPSRRRRDSQLSRLRRFFHSNSFLKMNNNTFQNHTNGSLNAGQPIDINNNSNVPSNATSTSSSEQIPPESLSGRKRFFILLFVLACLLLNFACFVSNKLLLVRVATNSESFSGCFLLLLIPLIPTIIYSLCQWVILEKFEKDDPLWRIRHRILVVVAIVFGIIEGLCSVFLIWVVFDVKNPLTGITATYLTTVVPCICLTISYFLRLRYLHKPQEKGKQKVGCLPHSLKVLLLLCLSLICTSLGIYALCWFFFDLKLSGTRAVKTFIAFAQITVAPNIMYKGLRIQKALAAGWNRHRYGLGLTKSLVKLIVILLCMVKTDGYDQFVEAFTPSNNMWMIWGMIISGIVSYFVTFISCKSGYQLTGIFIPLILSPLFCAVMVYKPAYCDQIVSLFSIDGCGFPDTATPMQFGELILASIPYWFLVYNLARKGMWTHLAEERDMFWQSELQVLSNDVSTLLNRDRKSQLKEEDNFKKHVYVAVTMWHEERDEVTTSVKALLDLMKYKTDLCDFECHFFIDSAFERNQVGDWKPNRWVKGLRKVLQENDMIRHKDDKQQTWFGLTEIWQMEDHPRVNITINCKDQKKLRGKKRWSQIVYLAEFFRDMTKRQPKNSAPLVTTKKKEHENFFTRCFGEPQPQMHHQPIKTFRPDHTYILMLDCDTRFEPHAVEVLVDSLASQKDRVGAVCGRIIPEGDGLPNPLVWFQEFEYAVSHWLNKSCEDIFGSVLCCPGAFSLVHMKALQFKVTNTSTDMKKSDPETCAAGLYCKHVASGMDVLKYDQGEDRLLCTFLIKNGWKLSYNSNAIAYTHCPTTFSVFFNQRRRWIVSTMANLCYLLGIAPEILRCNRSISSPFLAYIFITLVSAVLTPATVILLFISGFIYAFGISVASSIVLSLIVPLFYLFICIYYAYNPTQDSASLKAPKINMQVNVAFHLSLILSVVMLVAMIGIAGSVAANPMRADSIYFISLCIVFFISAFIQRETWILLYGIVYLFLIPAMYLILFMYAMNNMQDQGWGTREASAGKDDKLKHPHAKLWEKFNELGMKHFPRLFTKKTTSATPPSSPPPAAKDPLPQPELGAKDNATLVVKLTSGRITSDESDNNNATTEHSGQYFVSFRTQSGTVSQGKMLSKVVESNDPIWSETFKVPLKDRSDTVFADVYQTRDGHHQVIDSVTFDASKLQHADEKRLVTHHNIEFYVTLLMTEKDFLAENPQGLYKQPPRPALPKDTYLAVVKLKQAENLDITPGNAQGPYVTLWTKSGSVAKGQIKSQPATANVHNPVWAETFVLPLRDSLRTVSWPPKEIEYQSLIEERDAIFLQIYETPAMESDHLGYGKISVTDLTHKREILITCYLQNSQESGPKNGKIQVAVTLYDPSVEAKERENKKSKRLSQKPDFDGWDEGSLQTLLRNSVMLDPNNGEAEKKTAQVIANDLLSLRYTVGLIITAVTFCWICIGLVLTAHPSLNVLQVNAPGLLFVMAMGLLMFLQFLGMLFDIFGCFLQELALTKGIFKRKDPTKSFWFVGSPDEEQGLILHDELSMEDHKKQHSNGVLTQTELEVSGQLARKKQVQVRTQSAVKVEPQLGSHRSNGVSNGGNGTSNGHLVDIPMRTFGVQTTAQRPSTQ